ncbi:MAG: SDR family oxidoreductase, partial [Candidatus Omnitrophica bacterium]|nr:SDR family oxidoreductase [Candidatus Omnitrophota bacterium]
TAVCDIRRQEEVKSMVRGIQTSLGPIDVMINNAGVIQTGPIESMTVDDYENSMKTHFYGPLFTIEAVLPEMLKRKRGRIINIASIGGRISVPHLLPYCASKHALVGFTLGLRSELQKHGISVTAICPGLMRTGSPRNALFKGQHKKEYAWFKTSDSIPIVSTGAERAARQILEVASVGRAFYVVGLPHKLADKLHALAPGFVTKVLGWINYSLPGYGGLEQDQLPGFASESSWSKSWVNGLTERAALENNEHWTS